MLDYHEYNQLFDVHQCYKDNDDILKIDFQCSWSTADNSYNIQDIEQHELNLKKQVRDFVVFIGKCSPIQVKDIAIEYQANTLVIQVTILNIEKPSSKFFSPFLTLNFKLKLIIVNYFL